MKLTVTVGAGLHDRSLAFLTGSVVTPGVEFSFSPVDPSQLFVDQLRDGRFDVAEFSLSTYALLCSRGDERFVGLPVFPSRAFRHSSVVVNREVVSGIADLRDASIGAAHYQQTAGVWIRGILAEHHGVELSSAEWVFGGVDSPALYRERLPLELPGWLRWQPLGAEESLGDALVRGRLGAVIGARLPAGARQAPHVGRLFPDWVDAEKRYYEQTGIFPIMHVVVMRRQLWEQHPWLGEAVFEAFVQARDIGQRRLREDGILSVSLPWLHEHIEQTDALFAGSPPFSYGLTENLGTLEVFIRYAMNQGILPRPLDVREMFLPFD